MLRALVAVLVIAALGALLWKSPDSSPLPAPDPTATPPAPSATPSLRRPVAVPAVHEHDAPAEGDEEFDALPEIEQFATKYAGLTAFELENEWRSLSQIVNEASAWPIRMEYDAGRYEVIGEGKLGEPYQIGTSQFSGLITGVRSVSLNDGTGRVEFRRAQLLEEHYPELTKQWREVQWLAKAMRHGPH